MVRAPLTDLTREKNAIIMAIGTKVSRGLYDQALHDCFKRPKIKIEDVEKILDSIERKLRQIEIIFYTYFGAEYDPNIIVHKTLSSNKIIETEFAYATNVLKNRIEFNDPYLYKEAIDINFQVFILAIASLQESLVLLCETLLKKIVLYDGERSPYQCITLKILILNWDKLVELGYRRNDAIYTCIVRHRTFINKYLDIIHTLRNSMIHGYTINLEIDTNHNEYIVTNHDQKNFPPIAGGHLISELVLNNFTNTLLTNIRAFTIELLEVFEPMLRYSRTKLPM